MSGVKAQPYVAPQANGLPGNLPQSDSASMIDWSIPPQPDEQGRPYHTTYTGQRSYINDGSVKPPSPDGRGTFMHQYAWDPTTGTWKSSLNQSGILGLIEGAGAVAGPAIIGPPLTGSPTIFGAGGAAAAGSTLPSSTIPGMDTAIPAAVTSQGVSAGIPLGGTAGGLLPSSAIPGMTTTTPAAIASQGASAGIPLGTATAASVTQRLMNGLQNPRTAASVLSLIPIVRALTNGSGGGGSNGAFAYPQLGDLLNSEVSRVQSADSLAPMVAKLAASRMPITAK